ncbi:MAG TPA: hypothetical protein VFW73_00875 [Lacipirellulaceae bacterium]|nr:hypothetical protein [Lacipirellulaceae bacterium]
MQRPLFCSSAIVFGLLLAFTSSSALASTIVLSDDFNKSNQALVGTTPNISGGAWNQTGAVATNPIQIVSNAVSLVTSGQDTYAPFTGPVTEMGGNSIHTSMDIHVSAAQATGDYFSHLSDPVGTNTLFFQRLFAKSMSGGFQLGLAVTGGGGAAINYGTTVLNLNQTYHVDAYWNFVAGATNDTFDIDVDNMPYFSKTWDSTNAEPLQISAANFRQGSAGSAPTLTVDNLEVESVPEPTSLALGLLFGLLGPFVGRELRQVAV